MCRPEVLDEPASYEDLQQENEQLRQLLQVQLQASSETGPGTSGGSRAAEPAEGDLIVLDDSYDRFDRMLFDSLATTIRPHTIVGEADVKFPSREASNYLLAQGFRTSVWGHFAVHRATFEHEHDVFWTACPDTEHRLAYDPFWLALYFAFISVSLQLPTLPSRSVTI